MLSLVFLELSVGVRAFVIWLSLISSFIEINIPRYLRNHCNMMGGNGGIHYKTERKLSAWCISFPYLFGVDISINPKILERLTIVLTSTLALLGSANFNQWKLALRNEMKLFIFYFARQLILCQTCVNGNITRWYIVSTRAPRGTDRSPEYKEHFCYKLDSRVKNETTEWNQKQQHFITHALDHCYEFGLLL